MRKIGVATTDTTSISTAWATAATTMTTYHDNHINNTNISIQIGIYVNTTTIPPFFWGGTVKMAFSRLLRHFGGQAANYVLNVGIRSILAGYVADTFSPHVCTHA